MNMKKITIITAILALLTACFPDDRENNMVPDSIGVSGGELLTKASVHTGTFTVGVAKNGKGSSPANVVLSLDAPEAANAVKAWNDAHGTDYKTIPASMFKLGSTMLEYAAEDVVRTVPLTWDPVELAKYVGDSKDFVLPVCVKSDDLTVNPERQVLLINLLRTSISVAQKSFTRVIDRRKVEPDASGTRPELKETLIVDLKLDNSIRGAGISFPVKIDNSLIDTFNKGQEDSYQAAPAGLVTILTPTVSIPEGGESATFRVELDKSLLMKGGKLEAFPNYVIPVTIDTGALSTTLNGKEFELKGLSYGDIVSYITVTYLEIKPGLSVSREWGKYSGTASWSAYIDGFTAGADRNVAIDDNYIYVAETNKTKNIWAISRTDPGNYKKLPVGTVADDGIFYVSCPRIIRNTDPEINGGKDVLAVSSMAEGDPKLYVYSNGIDSDPVAINLTTWASRRLGDTFTYWGSLQEGILFFKDFNSAQGTVTFKLAGLPKNNTLYLVGRIVAPPATGAGAYFPFPDNVNSGVSSLRGGETAWLTTASKDLMKLEGADNSPTLTELSGYYADTAFRFFELGGKRYVAYTRQVSSSDGRLFILEGTPDKSWNDIILERNVVYHAAIQEEAENLEEYGVSPMSSGNSGMDLDARVIGSDVYIAVIKQNVGLSLFRLCYSD